MVANLTVRDNKFVQDQYDKLKAQQMCNHSKAPSPRDEDVEMSSGPLGEGSPDLIQRTTSSPDMGIVAQCAAARDQAEIKKEREFRSAHSYKTPMGVRPRPNSRDRHCMAIHVKVNDLDAYALLDSGCTTISVMHDFARVAKLPVMQLENPITLQLGTVGS